jgi:heme oxygenase
VVVPHESFLMWLFEETRTFHTRADAMIEARTTNVTTSSYRALLQATLGFEAPLEAALAYTPAITGLFELHHRSGYLVHDLLSLGMRPQEISLLPQCTIMPFNDAASAAGWLYVYERSRLQHPAMCMRIKSELPEVRIATQYWCTDDIQVTKTWSSFVSRLEALADERNARAAIRDAAVQAFEAHLGWFAANATSTRGIVSL